MKLKTLVKRPLLYENGTIHTFHTKNYISKIKLIRRTKVLRKHYLKEERMKKEANRNVLEVPGHNQKMNVLRYRFQEFMFSKSNLEQYDHLLLKYDSKIILR